MTHTIYGRGENLSCEIIYEGETDFELLIALSKKDPTCELTHEWLENQNHGKTRWKNGVAVPI